MNTAASIAARPHAIRADADEHDIDCAVHRFVRGLEPQRIAIASRDGGRSAALCEGDSGIVTFEDVQAHCREHPTYSVCYWERPPLYTRRLDEVMSLALQRQLSIVALNDGVLVSIGEAGVSVWLPTSLRPNTRDVCRTVCLALLKAAGVQILDAVEVPANVVIPAQPDVGSRPSLYEIVAIAAARALAPGKCAGLKDEQVLDVPGVLEFARDAVALLGPLVSEQQSTRRELARVLAPSVRQLVDRYLEQIERYNRRDMPLGFDSWESYHKHVRETRECNRVLRGVIAEVVAELAAANQDEIAPALIAAAIQKLRVAAEG